MSEFLGSLKLELLLTDKGMPAFNRAGRQLFRLLDDFSYQSDIAQSLIIVKSGFITDLESCPRIPILFDWVGDTVEMPAVIHDWLYTVHIFSRELSDSVLREACLLLGYGHLKSEAIYLGVREFGGDAYATVRHSQTN